MLVFLLFSVVLCVLTSPVASHPGYSLRNLRTRIDNLEGTEIVGFSSEI